MINQKKKQYNLYERNLYKYYINYLFPQLDKSIFREFMAALFTKVNKVLFHNIYINYIEIPITTKCSLRCRECSNLIQYYQCGQFYDYKKIIGDVHRLCQIAGGVGMLRILGGEPLLHPKLKEIMKGILKNSNINNIQIVTNGTMLFKEDILNILRDKRITIDISNYGKVSRNYNNLIRQLRVNGIGFCTNKELKWTEQADFTFQNKTQRELEQVLQECKLDCISMLNGEIHLCPRSSNGHDLKIFNASSHDYVNIRASQSKKIIKKEMYNVLNRKSIVACNYCKAYMQDKLKPCTAGEQVSREEALERYNAIKRNNEVEKNGFDCMGSRRRIY